VSVFLPVMKPCVDGTGFGLRIRSKSFYALRMGSMPVIRRVTWSRSAQMRSVSYRKGSLISEGLIMETPNRKVVHEVKALLHRWSEESDLEDNELLQCIGDAVDEYFDEDVVEFESDIDLEDDE
jgi:hypothetical protein